MQLWIAGQHDVADRTLNTMQVGIMLVSTGCGIGFLLGTGEPALHQGIEGCLYAVATALGLTLLAICAPALCTRGQSVWSQFNQFYGSSVARNVALLSLIWMTGVLAAQIRGGSAVLALTGLSQRTLMLLIIVLLVFLSQAKLSWLAAGFAFCLLACNLVLVDPLINMGQLQVWFAAPMTFGDPVQTVPLLLMDSIAGSVTSGAQDLVIVVLVTTALGSASSILRAMSDATAAIGSTSVSGPIWSHGLPVLLGTLVATRAQSLVDMMADLNVVYIASVSPLHYSHSAYCASTCPTVLPTLQWLRHVQSRVLVTCFAGLPGLRYQSRLRRSLL